jgi:hypothetical protein
MQNYQPKPTLRVELAGGRDRLREMILYVAERCAEATYFGAVKLNKIIWKADFDSFAARRVPITGREYRRRRLGPAAVEMLPIHRRMQQDALIRVDRRDLGDGYIEHRTIALVKPNLTLFDADDLGYVDASIRHYWDMTGSESSDESHGVAWSTRHDDDPMPYELAFLSDEPLSLEQRLRVEQLIYDKGWASG